MTINMASLTAILSQIIALGALCAAVIVLLKTSGVIIPVKGAPLEWTYVAIACAAAKMAR